MNTQARSTGADLEAWPALPLDAWRDTYATLHMWTQIVSKVRLALSPPVNHWWHVTLYVTARGLTTSPIPYGMRTFAVSFDFIEHNLLIQTSDGASKALGLFPRSVAEFYHEVMAALRSLNIDVTINTLPQEVPNPIRCDQETSTPPMTQSTPTASGASWSRPTACSKNIGRASWASAARSTSSGAVATWR